MEQILHHICLGMFKVKHNLSGLGVRKVRGCWRVSTEVCISELDGETVHESIGFRPNQFVFGHVTRREVPYLFLKTTGSDLKWWCVYVDDLVSDTWHYCLQAILTVNLNSKLDKMRLF